MKRAQDVLDFWFKELKPADWFAARPEVDRRIRAHFAETHAAASRGECFDWRISIEGRLAEIIVLDQFSRNMFRDDARMFAWDPVALVLAQEARAFADELPASMRAFAYMPFMHSESLKIHDEAMILFAEPGLEDNLKFEKRHRDIIARFGRFPHRNKILGRESTPEELEFLKQPGSSF